MKLGRLAWLLVAVIALAAAIEAYVAQTPRSSKPGSTDRRAESYPEPDKASSIRNTLAVLLTGVGVSVGPSLPTWDTHRYKEIRVRWQSLTPTVSNDSSNLLKGPISGNVTLLASALKEGTLPRDRSLELSTNQILAIALDGKGNLFWWKLLLDPRLVRAERPSATGEMSGEEYYLTSVDFTIACADDPAIKEIRLYHPQWTGKDFRLELIGSLPVQ